MTKERLYNIIENVGAILLITSLAFAIVLCIGFDDSMEYPRCKKHLRKVTPENGIVMCPYCYYKLQEPKDNQNKDGGTMVSVSTHARLMARRLKPCIVPYTETRNGKQTRFAGLLTLSC